MLTQVLAGRGELDAVATAVGRIGRPRDESPLFEPVDETHHMALVGIEAVGEPLLGERTEIGGMPAGAHDAPCATAPP